MIFNLVAARKWLLLWASRRKEPPKPMAQRKTLPLRTPVTSLTSPVLITKPKTAPQEVEPNINVERLKKTKDNLLALDKLVRIRSLQNTVVSMKKLTSLNAALRELSDSSDNYWVRYESSLLGETDSIIGFGGLMGWGLLLLLEAEGLFSTEPDGSSCKGLASSISKCWREERVM